LANEATTVLLADQVAERVRRAVGDELSGKPNR
jgi:hypothetical protein